MGKTKVSTAASAAWKMGMKKSPMRLRSSARKRRISDGENEIMVLQERSPSHWVYGKRRARGSLDRTITLCSTDEEEDDEPTNELEGWTLGQAPAGDEGVGGMEELDSSLAEALPVFEVALLQASLVLIMGLIVAIHFGLFSGE